MTRETITLTREEQRRLMVLTEVRAGHLLARQAAQVLGLSLRHCRRLLARLPPPPPVPPPSPPPSTSERPPACPYRGPRSTAGSGRPASPARGRAAGAASVVGASACRSPACSSNGTAATTPGSKDAGRASCSLAPSTN